MDKSTQSELNECFKDRKKINDELISSKEHFVDFLLKNPIDLTQPAKLNRKEKIFLGKYKWYTIFNKLFKNKKRDSIF